MPQVHKLTSLQPNILTEVHNKLLTTIVGGEEARDLMPATLLVNLAQFVMPVTLRADLAQLVILATLQTVMPMTHQHDSMPHLIDATKK
jgi:hypothetical protein